MLRKIALSISVTVFIVIFGYLLIVNSGSPDFRAINYYLPKEFEGCAVILYNQKDASPLTISNDKEIDIIFDENGFFKTSSPKDFGWQSEDDSGYHKANYFSGGTPLAKKDIHSHNSGSYGGDNAEDIQHESISVKTKDACQADLVINIIENNLK